MTTGAETVRLKVLVVEDETVIGLDIVLSLQDGGYTTDGPYATARAALAAIDSFAPDVAVLDINLAGQDTCIPVAIRLRERGTPFLVMSGYSSDSHTDYADLRGVPRVSKPVTGPDLHHALRDLLGHKSA